MNKNDFLKLLRSREPIDRQLLAEINELVNIFPYFQTAHLLLLKGLKDNSDVRFENQLKTSAIHVADREVLYKLLNLAPEPEDKNIFQEQKEEIISGPSLPINEEIQTEPEEENVPVPAYEQEATGTRAE